MAVFAARHQPCLPAGLAHAGNQLRFGQGGNLAQRPQTPERECLTLLVREYAKRMQRQRGKRRLFPAAGDDLRDARIGRGTYGSVEVGADRAARCQTKCAYRMLHRTCQVRGRSKDAFGSRDIHHQPLGRVARRQDLHAGREGPQRR